MREYPERMWVNQPSSLYPHHKLHGTNLLVVKDHGDYKRGYFLSGDIVSELFHKSELSKGWVK